MGTLYPRVAFRAEIPLQRFALCGNLSLYIELISITMTTAQEELSPAQYARATGYAMAYVYALLASGKLQAHKVEGNWRISSQELSRRQRKEAV